MQIVPLAQLSALARAGAVSRAWELFTASGYEARSSEPATLAVKGRLLKGRARLEVGALRTALMAEAAQAYESANRLSPSPYLAINAATLRLLGGDVAASRQRSDEVLRQLSDPAGAADTPYFLAATRAEALLLLGNRAGAEAAMTEAVRADPDGWADRATTIAQLREIAAAQGSDAGWIDAFAPPGSLHFAGHMGVASGGEAEAQLRKLLSTHLGAQSVGFAWGALAAGADIVIAEQVVAMGAALNVVLPCPADQFKAQSVAPAGAEWSSRFDALMGHAASIRIAADSAVSVHDPLATAFAGDLAIGGALCNAAQLASSAAQLIVCDEAGGGANTARQAERWPGAAGPQFRLTVPRDAAVDALFPPEQPDPARQLAVHLSILHDDLVRGDRLSGTELSRITSEVAEALSGLPAGSVRSAPGGWEASLTDLPGALVAIGRLARLGTLAIGAHRAIGPLIEDPASGTVVPFGPAPALARRLALLAQSGTVLVSDALAVSHAARGGTSCRTELYYPWEDELDGPVHILASQ
ncbi:MAG: tetratricopeptide repeat-containing protein [Novosphingobium sp.]